MRTHKHLTIKELPSPIRPRERLFLEGPRALSDTELLAIVLRTGREGLTAMELAQQLLEQYGSVGNLGNVGYEEIALTPGMGPAKAAQLQAAAELGRRMAVAGSTQRTVISNPRAVAELLMPSMRYLEREHFKALILNTKNQLLKIVDVAVGTLNAAIIQPRELYKSAIRTNGAAVIVVHNHPSGDVTPSREDITLTRRLAEAGRILGIDFVDHIIIGDGKFLSLKETRHFSG